MNQRMSCEANLRRYWSMPGRGARFEASLESVGLKDLKAIRFEQGVLLYVSCARHG